MDFLFRGEDDKTISSGLTKEIPFDRKVSVVPGGSYRYSCVTERSPFLVY